MSHELEIVDGKAQMAYVGEVPWHGLGVQVDANITADEMLEAAGLDWKVVKRPLYFGAKKQKITDRFALVREGDEAFFDVVGKNYVPTQNRDAFKLFKDFVEAGDATMETAGSLHDGQKVWGLAKLGTDFKLASGDQVKQHLLLMSPHKRGSSLIAKLVNTRVVCANTMAVAMREGSGEYRMPHVMKFDASAISAAKATLGLAREDSLKFQAAVEKLVKTKLPVELQIEHLAKVFAPKQEEFTLDAMNAEGVSRTMKRLVKLLDDAPGADLDTTRGTAWGAVNAATFWTSHEAARNESNRLDSAWTGQNATKVSTLVKNLLTLAE